MELAPLPNDEVQRLAALIRYAILDTPPEESFDRLTRFASQLCDTPIALISLIDSDRQWFKSRVGLDVPETPRDIAFCAHAILQPDLYEVQDAAQDPRFHDNPLVLGKPDIRFYAGIPLTDPNGKNLGTLCVIDRVPRTLNPLQRDGLRVLGRAVIDHIALHQWLREQRQREAEQHERERISRELEIARRIQATLLPRDLMVAGLDIAAAMQPCTEMGGDYYDIRRQDDGCWLGIGDVSGHGVSAGLVMLMLQCTVAALTSVDNMATPAEVLVRTNAILHDNLRTRMTSDDHITATLLRYYGDGRVVFAGAHEDLVVLRARAGECEQIETRGPWLGVVPDIRRAAVNDELRLEPGDTLFLYTDGLTEARNSEGQQFGIERVCAALASAPPGPARAVLEHILACLHAFTTVVGDDITAMVLRYRGEARET